MRAADTVARRYATEPDTDAQLKALLAVLKLAKSRKETPGVARVLKDERRGTGL